MKGVWQERRVDDLLARAEVRDAAEHTWSAWSAFSLECSGGGTPDGRYDLVTVASGVFLRTFTYNVKPRIEAKQTNR
jgi:hypothetical protein